MLACAEEHKRFSATAMNHRSSRAHCLLRAGRTQTSAAGVMRSELQMVDLAGCEQLKQSRAEGLQRCEAISISSSLLCLKKCLRALKEGRSHVPFLESKLPRLLQGALHGSCHTSCLVCMVPETQHAEQSLHALRFGEEAATVSNAARQQVTSVSAALEAIGQSLKGSACSIRTMAQQHRQRPGDAPVPQQLRDAYASLLARHSLLEQRHAQLRRLHCGEP